jgi:DNA-binding GntR family transcriptional regulator
MTEKSLATPLHLNRPTSLVHATVDRLRQAILDGDLQQGQHLVEASMARDLGISRGPLREAFKLLAAEGLLETRHDRGVFVPKHSDADVEQMIISRAILEGAAARLFVLRAEPEMRVRLTDLMTAMEQEMCSIDTSAWRELDWAFHETLLIGSGNPFLQRAWAVIGTLLRVFMLQTNPRYEHQREEVIDNHRRMCAALLGDDPVAAEAEFRTTILTTGYSVLGRPMPVGLIDGDST